MAITDGDILQIIEFQRQANQPLLNVYFYRANDPTGSPTLLEVAETFADNLWSEGRQALSSVALGYERVEVRNLTNGIDFAVFDVNENGSVSATEPLPPYCTVTIRLNRTTLVTRNGYKRYAGINEGQQNNGSLTTGALGLWETFAEGLASPMLVDNNGDSVDLSPVIVGVDPETGHRDLAKLNLIASVGVNIRLGTQNTRKIKSFS